MHGCPSFSRSNKPVAVIGGGDVACEEALFLARYASKVYIVQRFDYLEVRHCWWWGCAGGQVVRHVGANVQTRAGKRSV